ncbi:MAG: hypothetical protein NT150_09970 [Bacteroidetes bacterium]|nr:hypothetical protein [Bacteroidota bacterium]
MEELNLRDLSPYQKRLDIIEKTAAQVQKDFQLFNLEIAFSGNPETAYSELFQEVHHHIQYLWNKNQEALWNILYRIDLDEEKALKTLHLEEEPTEKLSDMILQRELKKVVIREFYKK